jgi:hypothetical protein
MRLSTAKSSYADQPALIVLFCFGLPIKCIYASSVQVCQRRTLRDHVHQRDQLFIACVTACWGNFMGIFALPSADCSFYWKISYYPRTFVDYSVSAQAARCRILHGSKGFSSGSHLWFPQPNPLPRINQLSQVFRRSSSRAGRDFTV